MHMSNALVSPAVGAAMCGVSTVAVAIAAAQTKKEWVNIKTTAVPMAITGAFVFAAQMMNFEIPGAGGVSGHIVGGILLAALIGASPALLTMSAILAVQCLLFADGGLLALGCNIFNMGVIPCLIVYPAVFKPLADRYKGIGGTAAAAVSASVIGLSVGAFAVALEVLISGVSWLPFAKFASLMVPVHLAIGAYEGLATAAVLCLVYTSLRIHAEKGDREGRPYDSPIAADGAKNAIASPIVARGALANTALVSFAVAAIVIGGGLSRFASTHPDGLEWSVQKAAVVDVVIDAAVDVVADPAVDVVVDTRE